MRISMLARPAPPDDAAAPTWPEDLSAKDAELRAHLEHARNVDAIIFDLCLRHQLLLNRIAAGTATADDWKEVAAVEQELAREAAFRSQTRKMMLNGRTADVIEARIREQRAALVRTHALRVFEEERAAWRALVMAKGDPKQKWAEANRIAASAGRWLTERENDGKGLAEWLAAKFQPRPQWPPTTPFATVAALAEAIAKFRHFHCLED